MDIRRLIRHLAASPRQVRRAFPPPVTEAIGAAIRAAEDRQAAEIRFVVEAALEPRDILQGVTSRERALVVFSQAFKAGRYGAGSLAAIEAVAQVLQRRAPACVVHRNELPDSPVLMYWDPSRAVLSPSFGSFCLRGIKPGSCRRTWCRTIHPSHHTNHHEFRHQGATQG